MEEIWKDIPGYEGRYQASTMGRIKSLDRVVRCGANGKGRRHIGERILKPGGVNSGHVSVVLGHKANGSLVHQLVMKTFVGPQLPGQDICHLNGDPSDNRLSNLRYDSRTENILDVYRLGKPWRKLTVNDVLKIRKRYAQGERACDLAKEYGLAYTYVFAVIKGRKCYRWLNESWPVT